MKQSGSDQVTGNSNYETLENSHWRAFHITDRKPAVPQLFGTLSDFATIKNDFYPLATSNYLLYGHQYGHFSSCRNSVPV